MKPLSTVLLIFCALSAHCSTWAAVIQRDWKTPGDGLLTFDTVNEREWLDLSQSRLSLFPGASREEQYQSVASELGPGGLLEGFIVAKGDDVRSLSQSAGIDVTTDDISNEFATRQLIALVGSTAMTTSGGVYAKALLDELTVLPPRPVSRLFGALAVTPTGGASGTAGLTFTSGVEPFEIAGLGVWLYRIEIPEPDTFSIALYYVGVLIRRHNLTRKRRLAVST